MTRLIPDWEIRITNFGLGYILMCLIVAIAATNTGNNGLYLVLTGMLAAMTVSGVGSTGWRREQVRLARIREPGAANVGWSEAVCWSLTVSRCRLFPVFS